MRADRLTLRCFAEEEACDLWIAVCLDLNLAVQGETYREVRRKLDVQIDSYLYEAMAGDDREYAEQLVPRYAPFRHFLKYYRIHLKLFWRHRVRDFLREIPLKPRTA